MDPIRQANCEELGVDRPAAFDHEPADSASSEVVQHRPKVEPSTQPHDTGQILQALVKLRDCGVRGVDQLLTAVVPELQVSIKVSRSGDRDLERVGQQSAWPLTPRVALRSSEVHQ